MDDSGLQSLYNGLYVLAPLLELVTTSRDQTQKVGRTAGELALPGDLFLLEGDLGSGKTTFVQGVGQGLGLRRMIHSPTFILANEYRGGRLPLFHVDAYRVRSAAEAIAFGLDDYLDEEGLVVIEWAEKIRAALPDEHLWCRFHHGEGDTRRIEFSARGARYASLLSALAERLGEHAVGN